MSPKNTLLTAGLIALGFFGFPAQRVADSGPPDPPSGPSHAPASSPPHTVLLLSNGRVLQGEIKEVGSTYELHQKGGVIKFPKSAVEETFSSIADVYKYKRASVPDRDPDEHLKLARWCLTQNMTTEAKAELETVIAVSPRATEAKAMLASIEAAHTRAAARPQVDPSLVQTNAEMPAPMDRAAVADPRPGELDVSAIRRAGRDLGVSGLPVIFDLPPALAVKRAEQFSRSVHPLLQAACARCHNERHEGKFQLVEVKTRRDLTADVFRANLDAALQLVDPENPARSELLSSALIPHGPGPNKRPIFRGSNDPRFQVLSAWVNSLRPVKSPSGVVPSGFAPTEPASGGGFASDRSKRANQGQSQSRAMPSPPLPFAATPRAGAGLQELPATNPASSSPRLRFVPSATASNLHPVGPYNDRSALKIGNNAGRFVAEGETPPADEFPVPFAVSGQMPRASTPAGTTLPAAKAAKSLAGTGAAAAGEPELPALPPDPSVLVPPAVSSAKADATKQPTKPVKIDPDLLQRVILNRNALR
jgi:hypothetical protein